MPFDRLPSLNLQIPQTHFAPLPARIPNQKGLMIAQALAQFIPEALKHLSPQERQKRQFAELEYKVKLAQYNALLSGKKSALEDVNIRRAEQGITESVARVNKMKSTGSGMSPEFAAGYEAVFGTKPPEPPPDEQSLTVPQPREEQVIQQGIPTLDFP